MKKKVVLFNQKEGSIVVRNLLAGKIDSLQCNSPIYDILSMTFSLLSDLPEQKQYTCYGNYRIWQLNAVKTKTVTLRYQEKNMDALSTGSILKFSMIPRLVPEQIFLLIIFLKAGERPITGSARKRHTCC